MIFPQAKVEEFWDIHRAWERKNDTRFSTGSFSADEQSCGNILPEKNTPYSEELMLAVMSRTVAISGEEGFFRWVSTFRIEWRTVE